MLKAGLLSSKGVVLGLTSNHLQDHKNALLQESQTVYGMFQVAILCMDDMSKYLYFSYLIRLLLVKKPRGHTLHRTDSTMQCD